MTYFRDGTLVTGSTGFLGSHLCAALRGAGPKETVPASVTDSDQLRALSSGWTVNTVVHLASRGSVVGPRETVPAMLDVTVDGTVRLLESCRPSRFLLASSCAIYGDTRGRPVAAGWQAVHPVSIYGLSKAVAELLLREWAETEGHQALVLRFGNLIGPGAKGLISYLVRHALRYPDGSEPAMMRGGGRLVRDYVPIDYAVRVMEAALSAKWRKPFDTFNVGTGRPSTNRQIAEIVQSVLRENGIRLRIHFAKTSGFGEAQSALLDCRATVRRFGIPPAGRDEIAAAVRCAVLSVVQQASLAASRAAAV